MNPAAPTTLYAGTDEGVFVTRNGGRNWVAASSGLTDRRIFSLVIDPTAPATLYAGTAQGGMFESTDGGARWEEASAGMSTLSVSAMAVDPATPALYFAVWNKDVCRKTEAGGNRMSGDIPLSSISAFAVDPSDAGVFRIANR